MRKFLLCLATVALSAFVAFADGYITSVKLPDGETRQFRDDSAWGQIESITQSISSIDFTSANTTLVATIHSQAPAPGNYAAVSNAAFYASNRVETAVQTSDLTTITSAVINAATDAATSIADTKFIPSESPDSSGRKASWNNGSFELGDNFSGEFSPSIGYDIDFGVLSTYSWTGFGWIRDSYWKSLQEVLDEKANIDDVDSIITQVVPEWAMSVTKPTYTASEVGAASESDFNYVSNQVSEIASNYITAAYISATNTVFSNAVVAVGLNIDTNLISALENYNAISNAAYYASNRVDSATLTNAYPATFVPETAQTYPYYLADTALMVSNQTDDLTYRYSKIGWNRIEVGVTYTKINKYDKLLITKDLIERDYIDYIGAEQKYRIFLPQDDINFPLGTVSIMFPRTSGTLATTNILSEVATTGNYADLINTPVFAAVATTGQYSSLIGTPTEWPWSDVSGKPVFAEVATNGLYSSLIGIPTEWAWSNISGKPEFAVVATNGQYSSLKGTPNLAPIATSGNYNDLTNTPTFASVAYSGSYTDLANKPTTWEWSNISGKPNFATVATTGYYSDLVNPPIFATVATSGQYADLRGKPSFADVATNGQYSSLEGIPTFADVATNGQYSSLLGIPVFSAVATNGQYSSLSGTPTKLSEFANDENFMTKPEVDSAISISAEANAQEFDSGYSQYIISTNTESQIAIKGDKNIFNLTSEVAKAVKILVPSEDGYSTGYAWSHLRDSNGHTYTYKGVELKVTSAINKSLVFRYSRDGDSQIPVSISFTSDTATAYTNGVLIIYRSSNSKYSLYILGNNAEGTGSSTLFEKETLDSGEYVTVRGVDYYAGMEYVPHGEPIDRLSTTGEVGVVSRNLSLVSNEVDSIGLTLTDATNTLKQVEESVATLDRIHGDNGTYLKADLKVYSSNGVVVVDIATWAAITNWVEQNFQRK